MKSTFRKMTNTLRKINNFRKVIQFTRNEYTKPYNFSEKIKKFQDQLLCFSKFPDQLR